MKREHQIAIIITLITLLLAAGIIAYGMKYNNWFTQKPTPVLKTEPFINLPRVSDDNQDTTQPQSSDEVTITTPLAGQQITSPVEITGETRGGWYFEAQFPITILDANNKEIGSGIAEAQGDWMTDAPVPFTATITFTTPTTPTGTILFRNDNPSGMPVNDKEFRLPVTFTLTK